MNQVYLILGSNLGDRLENIVTAREQIVRAIGRILKGSSVYKTESWGFKGADFLNQCILVESENKPQEILEEIIRIENNMGRKRTHSGYENRPIDIDILFYNDEVISVPGLEIPHNEIINRRFVLEPLNEIAPGLIHPVVKKEIRDLLLDCPDKNKVVKYTST